jgi:hypothetical protein
MTFSLCVGHLDLYIFAFALTLSILGFFFFRLFSSKLVTILSNDYASPTPTGSPVAALNSLLHDVNEYTAIINLNPERPTGALTYFLDRCSTTTLSAMTAYFGGKLSYTPRGEWAALVGAPVS